MDDLPYSHFIKMLNRPFDDFLKDKIVNNYLYNVGKPVIEDEVIISGYEIKRGHWGCYFNGKIRFCNEFININGLNSPMVLTPNFFIGQNILGEKIVYRLGIIKTKLKIRLFPVIIRNRNSQLEAKSLDDLCIQFVGKFIDEKAAYKLDVIKIYKINVNSEFLTCFWNIDDYLRKLNPNFYSDKNLDIWNAVETFSGRIIDQMLHRIIDYFKNEPDWLIKDIILLHETNLLKKVNYYLNNINNINQNQLKISIQNLCSYMNKFNMDKPLEIFIENPILIPTLIENFLSNENEVIYETFLTLNKIIKINPNLLNEISIKKLLKISITPKKKVRYNIHKLFNQLFLNKELLENSFTIDLVDKFTNLFGSKKNWDIFNLYNIFFEYYYNLMDESVINNLTELFLNIRNSQKLWDLYQIFEKLINLNNKYLSKIADNLMEGLNSNSITSTYVLNIYQLMSKETPWALQDIIEKLINQLIDDLIIIQDNALDALLKILKENPNILGKNEKKFIEFLYLSKSKFKFGLFRVLNKFHINNY